MSTTVNDEKIALDLDTVVVQVPQDDVIRQGDDEDRDGYEVGWGKKFDDFPHKWKSIVQQASQRTEREEARSDVFILYFFIVYTILFVLLLCFI